MGGINRYVDGFFNRLYDDRTTEALIRASTRLHEHEGRFYIARSQRLSRATSVDDRLDTHWPEEIPNAASR